MPAAFVGTAAFWYRSVPPFLVTLWYRNKHNRSRNGPESRRHLSAMTPVFVLSFAVLSMSHNDQLCKRGVVVNTTGDFLQWNEAMINAFRQAPLIDGSALHSLRCAPLNSSALWLEFGVFRGIPSDKLASS